jgi:hypothetical protein
VAAEDQAPDAARVDVRLVDLTRRFGDVAAVLAIVLSLIPVWIAQRITGDPVTAAGTGAAP